MLFLTDILRLALKRMPEGYKSPIKPINPIGIKKETLISSNKNVSYKSIKKLSKNQLSEKQKLMNRYVIGIQNGDAFQQVVLPLTDSSATELYYFLEESTLQRVQSHLDSLPKPSMDVITERKIKGSTR